MSTTTNPTLFGLSLAPLYAALAKVESDNGATSENVYQIRDIYVKDVNRIIINRAHEHHFTPAGCYGLGEVSIRSQSEKMMFEYWMHWGLHYQHKTGNPVTYEVLARIHNGGPLGWKKPATVNYWRKVKAEMEGGAK